MSASRETEGHSIEAAPRYGQRASGVLRGVLTASAAPSLSLDDLTVAMRGRAFGLLFFLLALGNIIPGPPGVGGIFGIPLLFFAVQRVMGVTPPRLPRALGRIRIGRDAALRGLDVASPVLGRIERLFRPRMETFAREAGERVVAGIIAVLAIAMTLPVPLTNFPPALATLVLALAVLERDGAAVIAGSALALLALLVVGFAISVYYTSLVLIFGSVFG